MTVVCFVYPVCVEADLGRPPFSSILKIIIGQLPQIVNLTLNRFRINFQKLDSSISLNKVVRIFIKAYIEHERLTFRLK